MPYGEPSPQNTSTEYFIMMNRYHELDDSQTQVEIRMTSTTGHPDLVAEKDAAFQSIFDALSALPYFGGVSGRKVVPVQQFISETPPEPAPAE